MNELSARTVNANGIDIHFVEQGQGPLVVFCHGFPESWYSWRHQLPALAAAGFRAVALDMRGYGKTSKPEAIASYSLSHLIGDVVGLVRALECEQAVIVGHDWGAPVAWYASLMRPDVFRATAALSVPYSPPMVLPEGLSVNQLMAMNAGEREYYRLYFQQPGVAEANLDADVRLSVLGCLYTLSGDIVRAGVRQQGWDGHFPKGQTMAGQLVIPERLPPWLSDADVDFYVKELTASGFRGGLNWYRNIDRLPGILAPFVGATLRQPVLYLYGEHDRIAGNTPEAIAGMKAVLPNLRGTIELKGAGHWLQQERPSEVNAALLEFLRGL